MIVSVNRIVFRCNRVSADRILKDIQLARHKIGDLLTDHDCNCQNEVSTALEKAGLEGE